MRDTWNGFQIDEDNYPLPRPGLYRIVHLDTDRNYVGVSGRGGGNVQTRARAHVRSIEKQGGRLRNAFRKYGLPAFLFQPLAYSIGDDVSWLVDAENAAILVFDAIRNGFNTVRNGNLGPYDKGVWADPVDTTQREATRIASYNNPASGYAEALKASLRAAWAEPASRAARVEKLWGEDGVLRRMREDPVRSAELRLRASEKTRKDFENPARRERQSIAVREAWQTTPRIWVNDGVRNKRVPVNEVPSGWQAGRTFKARPVAREQIWITDGVVTVRVPKDAPLPEGFRAGRTYRRSAV